MTIPSSDVDTDVVRMRALADALAASFGDRIMCPCSALPSSLSGGEAEPELHEADELLPGLEPSHLSETAEGRRISTLTLVTRTNNLPVCGELCRFMRINAALHSFISSTLH